MKWINNESLIVMRMNRLQNFWEFLTVSRSNGKSTAGLTESDPNGWVDLHRNYRFLENGNILWISERTGWKHLFLHSKNGKLINQITDGEWEVKRIVHIDENKNKIYFMFIVL